MIPPCVRENTPLAPFSYYKIGGPARFFAEPTSTDELAQVAAFIKEGALPYFILGAGSNILFDDAGFDGVVIQTGRLNRALGRVENDCIQAGASVTVAQLLRFCGAQGLAGLEFLVGVPGTVGGVLYMNAGTKTGEAAGVAAEVKTFDLDTGALKTHGGDEIQYSYRTQRYLGPHELVLEGRFRAQPGDPKEIQARIQQMLAARKASQPIDKPSCGSVFKNPDPQKNIHAWQLISQAGLRGHRIGGAQISEMHCNFIVNLGGAKASDVRALIELAKAEVKNRFGILLEEEVKLVLHKGTTTLPNA